MFTFWVFTPIIFQIYHCTLCELSKRNITILFSSRLSNNNCRFIWVLKFVIVYFEKYGQNYAKLSKLFYRHKTYHMEGQHQTLSQYYCLMIPSMVICFCLAVWSEYHYIDGVYCRPWTMWICPNSFRFLYDP